MDVLQLPAIPDVTPITVAWRILNEAARSALIVEREGVARLVTAKDLVVAAHGGAEAVSGAIGRPLEELAWPDTDDDSGIVDHLRTTRLGNAHRRLPAAGVVFDRLEALLPHGGEFYGLLRTGPGVAYIITGHETDAERYSSSPSRCYCTNPDPNVEHDYLQKPPDGTCDICGADVDCGN